MALQALVFDAYGTLYDVHSVVRRSEDFWPGKGAALSQLWRAKQLEYTWQRSLMRRYVPFSQVTREALAYACDALQLALDDGRSDALMQEYLRLATYPEVPAALAALRVRKAILSNGSPDMLAPLVAHSGLALDAVLSVDEAEDLQAGARGVPARGGPPRRGKGRHRLRLLQLLGRARRQVLRLPGLLDQPAEGAGGRARLPAGPHRAGRA